ncbi:hypothetical protein Mcup_1087 [Metallosphaera cuprina Ar-4]|uniref:Uncharacterized protein n=1 Tax=Metallosphaera cuprina (strain Ar-4) TaxID=1006006 RepID=F4G2Z4_METCR|nr:hypothetical protein Mcup_1087 [Metallosphaera cuprina Ar-4]
MELKVIPLCGGTVILNPVESFMELKDPHLLTSVLILHHRRILHGVESEKAP